MLVAVFGRAAEAALGSAGGARALADSPSNAWHSESGDLLLANTDASRGFLHCATEDIVAIGTGRVQCNRNSVAAAAACAYASAGLEGLRTLGGEYAFALWDLRERTLLLGCDPVGLRALAYTWDGKLFFACSRAVELLRFRGAARWNRRFIVHGLTELSCAPPRATAFEGIHRMVGGELIRVSATSGVERLPGERLRFRSHQVDVSTGISMLGARLDASISSRFDPSSSCVALSGGVDSCAVAAAVERTASRFEAFTVVHPGLASSGPGSPEALRSLASIFPSSHLHAVECRIDESFGAASFPMADDFLSTAPAFQAARIALLRTVRQKGFRCVFDGEGGDELFDMAWRIGDLCRQLALREMFQVIRSRSLIRALVADLRRGHSWPFDVYLSPSRAARHVRHRVPWLTDALLEGHDFSAAWREAIAYGRLGSPSERIPELLGAFGRYWRIQEIVRATLDLESVSPLVDRELVELVGSLPARVALNPRHRKFVLRRLMGGRVPEEMRWRRKREPLSQWLVDQVVASASHVEEGLDCLSRSSMLSEYVDVNRVRNVALAARRGHGTPLVSSSLVSLFAIAIWTSAIERAYDVR